MGKTRVSKRGVRGAKRLDVNQMRQVMTNSPMVTALGVVRKFPGESSHYEISTENGSRDVLVDVELIPSTTRVQCRLGFGGDGIYRIPRVNSEVAVLLPYDPQSLIKDSLDFEPIIVAILDTEAPSQLANDNTIVVFANSVLLGDSGAAELALKSDVQNLRDFVYNQFSASNGHIHATPSGPTTTMTTVASAASPPSPTIPSNPTGTSKTKAS